MAFFGIFKGKIKNKKIRGVLKFLLSCFIFYHLAMIFIVPHRMSMIHEKLLPYFLSYAYTLSLNTSWDFYAPNPSFYYYFEYEVIDSKDKVATFRWPPSRKESKRIYLNHNRLIYHARFFMVLEKKHIIRHFLPYLCRLHPTAKEISLKVLFENRPHFKKAGTFRPGSFSAESKERFQEMFTLSSFCKRKKKARDLSGAHTEDIEEEFENEMD